MEQSRKGQHNQPQFRLPHDLPHPRRLHNSLQMRDKQLIQNRMPYKVYHGKTGVIYNVTKSAVGVIIYKKVGNRYLEKRINVRIEHVSHSRSRDEFVRRVKENAEKKRKAKAEGTHIHLKRQPAMPRGERTISMKGNLPETITPIPYETTI
jgi:large subunit ribosomal protein L21e